MYNNLKINKEYMYAMFPEDYKCVYLDEFKDILGNCYYNEIEKILINESNLEEEFFNLKTRIAGEFLQKLVLFQFRAAFVISKERDDGRFGEMILESNKGNQFKFFFTDEEAIRWIESV